MKIEIDVDPDNLLEVLRLIESGSTLVRLPSAKRVTFINVIVDLKRQITEARMPKYAKETYADKYLPKKNLVNIFEESNGSQEG